MKQITPLQLKKALVLFTVFLFSIAVISCNGDKKGVLPTIAQTVVSLADLSQLEASAIKGNFVVMLSNKNMATGSGGNFTAFAPTNKAFENIGLNYPQDLNSLQTPFLVNLLKYHLSDGLAKDEALVSGSDVPSLLGNTLRKKIFTRPNGDKFVNGSKIIVGNNKADNGIVHVINRVLLASETDVAHTAIFFAEGKGFVKPELSFLSEAIVYCDLLGSLSDITKSYTVFAPTDQAFVSLGGALGISLNKPSDIRKIDKITLTQILLNHVTDNAKFTSQLFAGNLQVLNGKNVKLGEYNDGLLSVMGSGNGTAANMVIPDIQTTNGVVHIIDKVLLP